MSDAKAKTREQNATLMAASNEAIAEALSNIAQEIEANKDKPKELKN